MNTLLNIIWLLLGGLVLALEWVIAGILCIIFIITIPFARGCFEMATSCLTPFGKKVQLKSNFGRTSKTNSAFLWIIFAGIWLVNIPYIDRNNSMLYNYRDTFWNTKF